MLHASLGLIVLLFACSPPPPPQPAAPAAGAAETGLAELDAIISAALSGNDRALVPFFEYSRIGCTTVEGLGGPPKCRSGEADGTPVDVLPFLGPGEGSHLRKADVENWVGPELSRLYAAYRVSAAAYSEQDFPAGEYALVLVSADIMSGVTLQVRNGRIVRIDYALAYPPEIRPEDVSQYLVTPG